MFNVENTMLPSQDEQKEQQHQGDNGDNSRSILNKEIDSWSTFEYALREENRLLFNKMLSECKENEGYIKAAGSKDEFFSAESLFMVLILQQQKMINKLIAEISKRKKNLRLSRYSTTDT
jgi:hypothetical protein